MHEKNCSLWSKFSKHYEQNFLPDDVYGHGHGDHHGSNLGHYGDAHDHGDARRQKTGAEVSFSRVQ